MLCVTVAGAPVLLSRRGRLAAAIECLTYTFDWYQILFSLSLEL
jgi:hypothetical protein